MNTDQVSILSINSGSSSIKFAFFHSGKSLIRMLYGKIDRIGLKDSKLTFIDGKGTQKAVIKVKPSDNKSVANFLIDWLEKQIDFSLVMVIGHRVVFGMKHTEPELVTQNLLDKLHNISPYDSDHLPAEIELIAVFSQRYPDLKQVACFDTAFHSKMPRVAKLLPIPRRFDNIGIQRYGFHGLSYAYLIEELIRVAGKKAGKGRVILAHLGNGASIAAVFKGNCQPDFKYCQEMKYDHENKKD